jgi:hypothetical protein
MDQDLDVLMITVRDSQEYKNLVRAIEEKNWESTQSTQTLCCILSYFILNTLK